MVGDLFANPTEKSTENDVNGLSLDLNKQLPATMTSVTDYRESLKQLPEVQRLTNELNLNDMNTIASFGSQPAMDLARVSEDVMSDMRTVKVSEVTEMMYHLTRIMDKIEVKELKDPEAYVKGIRGFLRRKKDQAIELFDKYDSLSGELNQVHSVLLKYVQDIKNSNARMSRISQANYTYYENLEKYIAAGELGLVEIDEYKNQLTTMNLSEHQVLMKQNELDMMRNNLEQRVYDLRVAENIALQNAPMITTLQQINYNLGNKIESAFISTLPAFRTFIINQMTAQRQKLIQNSLKQLDDKTEELMRKNATLVSNLSVESARMANSSGITIDTLQKTYDDITKGIEDTKLITAELQQKRKENTATLESMKREMISKGWA